MWREKRTDPGKRPRPGGDDSIATQWGMISLLIQAYMHGGNRLFMVWTLITCGGIWQGLELDNKMDGATIVKYNKSSRFGWTEGIYGEGNGNPLQYSCLDNPMDKGAWWATVHRVAQSWTQLKWLSRHTCRAFINIVRRVISRRHTAFEDC